MKPDDLSQRWLKTKQSEMQVEHDRANQGFYFRCVCCNASLPVPHQTRGVCSTCWQDVSRIHNPVLKAADEEYMETMWRNPMGQDVVEELVGRDGTSCDD